MRRKFILLLVALFVVLIGCSKDKETVKDNGLKEHTDQKKPEEVVHENAFPLTGIGTNEESVQNRAIGVMVNNHTAARPQTGLSKADIVFEILAEGDITRFLALFQSEHPEAVGPVRSAREYYFELANGYNALYVYHGAANFVNDMIKNRGIDHLNGAFYDNDGHLFKREPFRVAPHNSYLQFNAAYDVAEEKGYEIMHPSKTLPFLSEEETIEGDPAQHVKIGYTGQNPNHLVEFSYDREKEKYTRYEDQQKTVELNSEDPIQVDNVFIIEAYHEVFDNAGRRKIDLNSGGTAYLIQKGKIQQLEWENQDGRIIPVMDGQPVGFVRGKTWINVVPSSPGIGETVEVSNE